MIITRNTLRADGLTVGEAMDRDAAFLRSLGFDAKDGQPTLDEKREAFRDAMRDAVLDAMDEHARTIGQIGPKDRELPKLFAGVDAIADRVFNDSTL